MDQRNKNDDYSTRRQRREREEASSGRRVRRDGDTASRRRAANRSSVSYQSQYGDDKERRSKKVRPEIDKSSEELRAMRRKRHAEALGYNDEDVRSREKKKKTTSIRQDEMDYGMERKKKKVNILSLWAVPDLILLVLQAILSVAASHYLKKLLPMKYWIVLVLLLLFAFGMIAFGMMILKQGKNRRKNGKAKKNGKRIVARIVSVVLSTAMVIGCLAAKKGFSALNDITGGEYQTHVISLAVKSDSNYNELKDVEGKTVAIAKDLDSENIQKALDEIADKEKVDIETEERDNILSMAQALTDGEVDAVLFSEAYRGVIEDSDESFSNNTRIIYQYEIQEELKMDVVEKEVADEPFSIYISGIDTYGPVSTVSRSDVNMVVTVNPKTKQILMTSIPRDYYVPLATSGVKDKLTHAGIYGVEESMGTLENLFGVEIDYYARVNFTSLIKMVDALGGITVNNPQAFTSYHTQDYYPEGQIDMDGDTALEFVRERYGLAGGDNDRVKNQQRVLTAMLEKAMSPAIIKNYSRILDAVSGSFVTNMASEDIQKLIQMQLDDMASWDIEQIAVTGKGTKSTTCYSAPGSNLYVMEPNYDSVNEATEKIKAAASGETNE